MPQMRRERPERSDTILGLLAMRMRWPRRLLAIAAVGVSCAAAPAALAQDRSLELLERYRPQLVLDSAEEYTPQPVNRHGEARPVERIYGHLAREGDTTWLQYWLFYPYNPQDRGVLKTGRHEGDWELVQLRLDRNGRPDRATMAQHTWAEGCAWSELERRGIGKFEIPVVYVANGSQANHSRPGTYDRPWPDPNDEADGHGRRLRPPLEVITDDAPRWVTEEARWGESRASFIPGEESSPQGPMFQPNRRWSQPSSFDAEVARTCGSGPPGRPWQNVLSGALGLTACGGLAVAVRRKRRRRRVFN
jgi:hypothetical protein